MDAATDRSMAVTSLYDPIRAEALCNFCLLSMIKWLT